MMVNRYFIKENGLQTTACFPTKELAENFITNYNNWVNKNIRKIEAEIIEIYGNYSLTYGCYDHEYIFNHLIDTGDIIESDDRIRYKELQRELEEYKTKKFILEYEKV